MQSGGDISVFVYEASGNGAFLVTPLSDAAYTAGTADGLIPTMTVSEGVSGFTYFAADIGVVLGHEGEETAVFVQMRNGKQVGIMGYKGDFDGGKAACACFNVQAGDVIKIYIVDELTNGAASNPTIL